MVNKHIMGCQFHPEKSHRFGMRLLKTSVNLKPWFKQSIAGFIGIGRKLVKQKYRKPQYPEILSMPLKFLMRKRLMTSGDISTDRAQKGPNSQIDRRIADRNVLYH